MSLIIFASKNAHVLIEPVWATFMMGRDALDFLQAVLELVAYVFGSIGIACIWPARLSFVGDESKASNHVVIWNLL